MKAVGRHVQSHDWLYVLVTLSLLSDVCIHGGRHSRRGQGRRAESRIINGDTAERDELPYQLYMRTNEGTCGAVLIGPSHALTAAHCIVPQRKYSSDEANYLKSVLLPKDITLIAGQYNRYEPDGTELKIPVGKIIKHFGYKNKSNSDHDDIALLKFVRPVSFNKSVQPIQLPSPSFKATGMVLVSGWGTAYTDEFHIVDILEKVSIPIVTNADCARLIKSAFEGIVTITSKQICAGYMDGKKTPCSGDSGGPLVKIVGKTKILVGIASYVSHGCVGTKVPSVYSSVAKYRDWIDYNIKK